MSTAVLRAIEGGALRSLLAERHDPETTQELARVETQQAELAREWAEEGLSAGAWRAARAVLEARERELRQRLAATTRVEALRGLPERLEPVWAQLPLYRRRAIVQALCSDIIIVPATVRGRNRFDSSRVSIRWRA